MLVQISLQGKKVLLSFTTLISDELEKKKKKGEGNPQAILEAMTPNFLLFFWKKKKKRQRSTQVHSFLDIF